MSKNWLQRYEKEWLKHIDHELEKNKNPDSQTLTEYATLFDIDNDIYAQLHKTAIETKLASTKTESNLLATTMTRYQLFSQNNPLWAHDLTIKVINSILCIQHQIERPSQAEFFKEHFEDYCISDEQKANTKQLGTVFLNA